MSGDRSKRHVSKSRASKRHALMSSLLAGALILAGQAQANMILNGGFETNTAITTSPNVPNATLNTMISNFTAFGSGNEIDLVTTGGFGIAPHGGDWKIGMNSQVGAPYDALSLDLSSSISSGSSYDLQLFLAGESAGTLGPVEVGISSSATSFGTLVYSATPTSSTAWDQFDFTFVAPNNATYLTFRTSSSPDLIYSFVDDISLVLVPEPSTALLVSLGLAGIAARRRRAYPRHNQEPDPGFPAGSHRR